MSSIGFFPLHKGIEVPEIKTETSACFDLSIQLEAFDSVRWFNEYNQEHVLVLEGGSLRIPPHSRVMIPMGYILEIPEGYSIRLHPRSSVALKRGLVLANQEAVIDHDFVEELQLLIHNHTSVVVDLKDGDRIAQGELVRMEEAKFHRLQYRPARRGDRTGGIGSTGV